MAVIILSFIIVAAILYPRLPAQLPMQWSMNGEVNYTLPKLPVVSVMVLVDLGFGIYTLWLHRSAQRIPVKDFLVSLLFPILFSIVLVATQIRL